MLFLVTRRDGAGYQEHAQGLGTTRTRLPEIGICTLGKVDQGLPSAPTMPLRAGSSLTWWQLTLFGFGTNTLSHVEVRSKVTAKSTGIHLIYVNHFLSLSFLSFKLPESCRIGDSSNLVIMEMTLEKKSSKKIYFSWRNFILKKKFGNFSDEFRYEITQIP